MGSHHGVPRVLQNESKKGSAEVRDPCGLTTEAFWKTRKEMNLNGILKEKRDVIVLFK